MTSCALRAAATRLSRQDMADDEQLAEKADRSNVVLPMAPLHAALPEQSAVWPWLFTLLGLAALSAAQLWYSYEHFSENTNACFKMNDGTRKCETGELARTIFRETTQGMKAKRLLFAIYTGLYVVLDVCVLAYAGCVRCRALLFCCPCTERLSWQHYSWLLCRTMLRFGVLMHSTLFVLIHNHLVRIGTRDDGHSVWFAAFVVGAFLFLAMQLFAEFAETWDEAPSDLAPTTTAEADAQARAAVDAVQPTQMLSSVERDMLLGFLTSATEVGSGSGKGKGRGTATRGKGAKGKKLKKKKKKKVKRKVKKKVKKNEEETGVDIVVVAENEASPPVLE